MSKTGGPPEASKTAGGASTTEREVKAQFQTIQMGSSNALKSPKPSQREKSTVGPSSSAPGPESSARMVCAVHV